jgi:hypothetical protein
MGVPSPNTILVADFAAELVSDVMQRFFTRRRWQGITQKG